MRTLLSQVPAWLFLVAAIFVVAVVIVLLILLARQNRKKPPLVPDGFEDMVSKVQKVFASAEAALGTRLSDRLSTWITGTSHAPRDTGKRFIVMGPAGSGKTTLLRQLTREATFAPVSTVAPGSPCNLFRFEGALLVEVAGRVLRDGDARGQGGRAFLTVLSELRRAFPDRPVDGILLTLPMAGLLASAARDKLAEEAVLLRRRLEQAMRTLAMRVPVYLLVTQCDAIPTFQAFAREVGEARRQRTIGWSRSTGDADDPAADWVVRALESVSGALAEEQHRRFAVDSPLSHPEDYFVFPAELTACGSALGHYVDRVFHDAASSVPPELRGIYFMGRVPSEDASHAPLLGSAPQTEKAPPVLFVWDLLTRKILPEANLAKPTQEAQRARLRTIRVLQVASVVVGILWGALLGLSYTSTERRAESVVPFLEQLNSDLVHVTAGERASARDATALLDMLGGISADRLVSYAVPTSWASRIDSRLKDAIALGYDQVILAAYREAITGAGAVRPYGPPNTDGPDVDAASSVDRTPEFERADDWLNRLEAYAVDVERYNQIVDAHERRGASEREIQAIADLSDSLLRHKVDQGFFSHAKYYTSPLNRPMLDPQRIDVHPLVPQAQADAAEVFGKLHKRLYALYSGPVVPSDLRELIDSFSDLEDPNPEFTTRQLRRLDNAIKAMEQHVGRDGLKWIPNDQPPPMPEKQEALYKRVGALRTLLGPAAEGRLRQEAKTLLLELQDRLRAARDPMLGLVMARKPGGERLEMKLASEILALSEPTDTILRKPYMTGAEDRTGKRELPVDINISPDTRVEWDIDTLKNAAKVLKDYDAMLIDGPLDKFPQAVQGKIRDLTRRRVQVWLHGLFNNSRALHAAVASTAGPVPYHVLRADSENVALAGAALREILSELGRTHIDDSRDQLRTVVRRQGARVLRVLNRSFDAENLYYASFAFWNGDGTPAFRAFQATDAAQLAENLVEQRTRAEKLAHEIAEPVLAVIESPEVGTQDVPEVTRWDRIVSSLKDFEAKKAGNSVALLEHFISVELPAITDLDKCLAMEKSAARGRDFFGERRRYLFDALRKRCLAISREDMRDWYERLRLEFNRSLQDRFPFSKNDRAEDAPPEAVRSFLLGASEFRKRYRTLLADRRDLASRDIVRFLDRAEDAKTFLAPLWAQNEAGDGAYEVRVEFRVNGAHEVGGSEIADWSFRAAEEQIFLGGQKSLVRWHVDDPVRVQFRWAKNSPDMPVPAQGNRGMVRERMVTFEEQGLWSLLRLISAHQSTMRDIENRTQGSSLLAFTIRTIPDPQGGFVDRPGTSASASRVFLRLTVTGSAKDKPLPVRYPEFPTKAPAYIEWFDRSGN